MSLAVWIIYAADRLLDASRANRTGNYSELEARHCFHDNHRRGFIIAIAVASIALGALLPILDISALHLYLVEGALLTVWLLLLHATPTAHRLPKEIAVGLFFSAAVFIPTVARNSSLRLDLAPAAILLAILCALNCLFIYAWEHYCPVVPNSPTTAPPHITTKFVLDHVVQFAMAITLLGIALAINSPGPARPIVSACTLSSISLLLLHRHRAAISRIHLRAAADFALLTPFLLLPLMLHPLRW